MSNTDQPNREKEIFEAALDIESAEDRLRFLKSACADDTALLARVQALLHADETGESFLPEQPQSPTAIPLALEKPGDRIGRYKLLQQIGEGGCGVVYMAEQEEPVRRQVALKVIKLGMETKPVLARFEAERQALALMDHPNIAKVLDAGATDTGRPYFVMELVRGTKITDYCDEHKLPTRERLDLFMQVCHAIQHAHQKGVIHRDIKPSNILVTRRDGVPVPKVIDFGIAKATTDQRLTDKTLFTAFEQFLGTPAYMSPEQAEMSELGIDTRSDIYSLGVLLYELLTGQTPFDAKELLQAGLDAMRRTIREKEPARPSTRLSTLLAGELTSVAARRQTDPPKLIHVVRGELDWIVMKSLEKDRARRYETANGLARDVQRYLAEEAVIACPPSNLYRFQKLVRRNKPAVTAASAVVAALLIGLGISTWMFFKEKAARERAVTAEKEQSRLRQQAEAAEQTAKSEGDKSREVARFLKGMLNGVGPSVAKGRDTQLLREISDKTLKRVRNDLHAQPEIEAELLAVIGGVYLELGQYAEAAALRREVLDLRKNLFGPEHRKVADALNDLANVFFRQSKFAEAETMHRDALAMRRKLLGDEHEDVATSLNNLGNALWQQGKLAEAETVLRESLAIRKKLFGDKHADVADSLSNLAAVLSLQDKLPEAEAMMREVLALDRNLKGNDHPDVAVSLHNLADILTAEGKFTEAETFAREALALRRKFLGDEHPDVALTMCVLATTLARQGRLAEAEALHREALALRRKLLPPDHLDLAMSLNNLGEVLLQARKFNEAEAAQREALEITRKSSGANPQDIAGYLNNWGLALRALGRFPEAEAACREALTLQKQIHTDDHPDVTFALQQLAQTFYRAGKPAEAASLFTEAARQFRQQAEKGDAANWNRLAWFLATCPWDGERDGRTAVTYAEKAAAATDRKDPALLNTLAAAYAEVGLFEQAVVVQKEAINLLAAEEAKQDFASRLKLYESKTPYRDTD